MLCHSTLTVNVRSSRQGWLGSGVSQQRLAELQRAIITQRTQAERQRLQRVNSSAESLLLDRDGHADARLSARRKLHHGGARLGRRNHRRGDDQHIQLDVGKVAGEESLDLAGQLRQLLDVQRIGDRLSRQRSRSDDQSDVDAQLARHIHKCLQGGDRGHHVRLVRWLIRVRRRVRSVEHHRRVVWSHAATIASSNHLPPFGFRSRAGEVGNEPGLRITSATTTGAPMSEKSSDSSCG